MALLVKLEKYLYSSDYQFGFKPKHSTDLCIYSLTEVIEFYKSQSSSVYVCFMDASNAFDRVKSLLGCHKFKSLGKLSNGWVDWHQIWHTSGDPSGNGDTPNKLPLEKQGGTWRGFWGQTFKCLGKLSNGWTDWHQLWFTSADSSGNGHRLNQNRLSIPQGVLGGGEWLTNSKVWGGCQTAAPIGTEFGTRRRIRLGMDIG